MRLPYKPGNRIYLCQTGDCGTDETLNPVGQVVSKKGEPNILGLRNQSGSNWDAMTTKGTARKVMPNDVIPSKDGIRFIIKGEPHYPGTTAEIRAN